MANIEIILGNKTIIILKWEHNIPHQFLKLVVNILRVQTSTKNVAFLVSK